MVPASNEVNVSIRLMMVTSLFVCDEITNAFVRVLWCLGLVRGGQFDSVPHKPSFVCVVDIASIGLRPTPAAKSLSKFLPVDVVAENVVARKSRYGSKSDGQREEALRNGCIPSLHKFIRTLINSFEIVITACESCILSRTF